MDLVRLWLSNFTKYHGWLVAMQQKKEKMEILAKIACWMVETVLVIFE